MKQVWDKLIKADIWINMSIFRGQRETMSDRMGEQLLKKNYGCCKWRKILCSFLSIIDPRKGNHCIESIETID